jgi:hypothetical protein
MTTSMPGNQPRQRDSHWRARCGETRTAGSEEGDGEKGLQVRHLALWPILRLIA